MSETPKTTNHNEDIVRLNPMEHVRKRPGMYIGGTDEKALHYLIYEIVDNGLDLTYAGQCDHIWVTLLDDNEVRIEDNGPGISTTADQSGISSLETTMTEIGMRSERLPTTKTFFTGNYRRIGFAAINALSERMSVETICDGWLWKQNYGQGKPQDPISKIRPANSSDEISLSFTFRPDFTIFEPNQFNYDKLIKRFREISFLAKGLTIIVRDKRDGQSIETILHSDKGIVDYLEHINTLNAPLHEPIYQTFEIPVPRENYEPYRIKVELAFQYANKQDCDIKSFVNTVEIIPEGQYVQAICSTLTNLINSEDFYRSESKQYSPIEATRGLTLVMHILHPSPSFRAAISAELLVEPELYGGISEAIFRAFNKGIYIDPVAEWLAENEVAGKA